MKLTTLAMAVVTTMALGHAAEARTYHRPHTYRHVARSRIITRHRWARRDRPHGFGEARYAFSGDEGRGDYGSQYAFNDDEGRGHYRSRYAFSGRAGGGGYGPRPAEWCGWEMRHLVSSDPGVAFNRAAEWAHWGHAGPAGVGAVVVWPHHVGKIVGQEAGMWVIESGNDGHALRTRPRSIGGAIAIRWS
jgi:hypothetical protein